MANPIGTKSQEFDLTNAIQSLSGDTISGMVGDFEWGPAFEIMEPLNENNLIEMVGKPTESNYKHWYSAKKYLEYVSNLKLVRAIGEGSYNSSKAINNYETGGVITDSVPKNLLRLNDSDETTFDSYSAETNESIRFLSKYPGTFGNNIKIAVCNYLDFELVKIVFNTELTDENEISVGDSLTRELENGDVIEYTISKVKNVTSTSTTVWGIPLDDNFVELSETPGDETWKVNSTEIDAEASEITDKARVFTGGEYFKNIVTKYKPVNENQYVVLVYYSDELKENHVVSSINEENFDSINIFADEYLKNQSMYIISNTKTGEIPATTTDLISLEDGTSVEPTKGDILTGYDIFADAESVDVQILFDGGNTETSTDSIDIALKLSSIAESRKDIHTIVSVPSDIINQINKDKIKKDTVSYRRKLGGSSYQSLFFNELMTYSTHLKKDIWISPSSDVSGVYSLNDYNLGVWEAAAGKTKGAVKNIKRLKITVTEDFKKLFAANQINPIVTTNGVKNVYDYLTLKANSFFEYSDIRRLVSNIVKNLRIGLEFVKYEKNKESIRNRAWDSVDTFLNNLKVNEAIFDYSHQCDEKNNTPSVIDEGTFIMDIAIKPFVTIRQILIRTYVLPTGMDFSIVVN